MNDKLEYLFYCLPVIFIFLARRNMLKLHKLADSGKVPYIVAARQRQIMFFYLAILSALIILVVTVFGIPRNEVPF